MKNPLRKRLPRELKDEFGKYLVIFLFMTLTIGLVSGFLVAGKSMVKTYNDSFEEYNIEDGHFILNDEITGTLQNKLEDEEDITVYSLFYKEEEEGEHTYRIYKNREDIDGVSVHKGRIPEKDGEIAIDRKFADSADLKVGDKVTLDKKEYEITGLVALSDYSALFRSNTDLMFDAQNFTVAVVTPEAFNRISDNNLKYCYAWKYDNTSLTDKEKKDKSDDIKTFLAKNAVMTDFVPEPDNQAIHFAGDDMGSDTAMVMVLLYIVIIIMAFIFAVTSISTIEKESTVIGTLRASGYTRKELVIHYMELPMIIMFIGAIIGNILGYTIFKDIVAAIYYNSYSLTVYTTIWSPYAFVMTTIIPCVLMFVINLFMLTKMLKLSPLKFIRRDLKKRKNRKAVKLPEWKFFTRFRTRIIFQNISSYIIMLIGIAFSSIMLLFGLVMQPVLNDYKKTIIDNMPCKYKYILKMPVEIKDNEAEKYAITKLEMQRDNGLNDEFTVYGLNEDSQYFNIDFSGLKDDISDPSNDSTNIKTTIRLMQPYGLAYAYVDHVGIQRDYETSMFKTDKSSLGSVLWATVHEVGHQMDIDARAWPEITNNMWANNAHIKQGFDDRVNYTYIYKYLAPEKSLRGFEEMDYFQKLGMFWQLQLKKDTYWAELESLYRKRKPSPNNYQQKKDILATYSSEVLNINLTYYFEKYGFDLSDECKEKLKKYPTSNEKLWYLNSSVMNYEGQGFDNVDTNLDVTLSKSKSNIKLTMNINKSIKNDLLGYEIIKDGIEIPINQTSITIKNIQKYMIMTN